MLDSNIQAQLKEYLKNLRSPIELVASLDNSEAAGKIRTLITQIAELSPEMISVNLNGNYPRKPSFGIAKKDEIPRVHFAGLPMGHEFTTLILALLQVGGHPPKISAEQTQQIKSLTAANGNKEVFETFISLSCHNCPDVVQAFNLIATLNPQFESVLIDGALFQDEAKQKEVMAVPNVFRNGEAFWQGRTTLEEILANLDTQSVAQAAAKISEKTPFDVLVIGGGPAGSAAAIYAARKGIHTGLVAERFGGQILDTLSIENFISVPETEGPKLAKALENHVSNYPVDVMNLQRVEKIAKNTQTNFFDVELTHGGKLKAKTVILATGAKWREMNVPGEKEYKAKGVCFCPHCDGPLFKGKRVAVIGGGNSGVEAAIDLAGIVAQVVLIEFDSKLRADAVLQEKLKSLPNVEIITSAMTTEVLGDGNKVVGLTYQNRTTGEIIRKDLEGIFVQIGLVPNTDFLKDSDVKLTPRGEIEINAKGETSADGIFAAGDCTTQPYKQIIISMGSGATAALSAFDYLIRN